MTSTCPVHQDFDPLAADYLADPYPVLSAVREEAPVFYSPSTDMWVVTRYADIDAIFKDPGTYSASVAQSPVFPLAGRAKEILAEGFHATPTMSNCDPPRHTRIRAHNVKAFSARRIAVLEPRVRAKASELVAAIRPGPADLVSALTYPLPAWMIFTLIGFPDQDTDMLKDWCGNRLAFSWGKPGPDEQAEIAENMVRYWRYCEEFVAGTVRDPRDDFTSDLVRVHLGDPAALSPDEITSIIYGLSFAGHETTTNLTANALRRLLSDRKQWEDLCADPEGIPGAVEEVLRYDTSVIAWRRITTRPVTVGGVEVPANAKLMLLLASAGRDPDQFPDPESFDIHRWPAWRSGSCSSC
jgi:cytochrome P450